MLKKILITTILLTGSSFAEELVQPTGNIYKEQNLTTQYEYLTKRIDGPDDFELGIYFANLLKDNPKELNNIIDIFKNIEDKRKLTIILKYAGIQNTFYEEDDNNIKVIDPLKYDKYYYSTMSLLIGQYRYSKDIKYIEKLYEISEKEKEKEKENPILEYKLKILENEYPEVKDFLNSKKPKIVEEIKKEEEKTDIIPEDEFIK